MNIKLINSTEFSKDGDPLTHVLNNRGVKDIEAFFNISWDSVQTPYALNNIEAAADMMIHHMKNSRKIAFICDSDCDGFVSLASLINYLDRIKGTDKVNDNTPEFSILFHEEKTHGLSNTVIMRQLRDEIKPDLLVIPDASGSDEQYSALNELGIEILVLDHHDTYDYGDGQNTVVVNNQHSSDYHNKTLTGVGVVYQFLRVLDERFRIPNYANQWLDLCAVGLVADVADLRNDETRFLVMEGLKPENINNPLLRLLLQKMAFSLKGDYNPQNIAFYVGPLFNAISRVGSQEEKEQLFKSLLDMEALEEIPSGKRGAQDEMVPLMEEAYRKATNAKSRQKRRQDKLTELIDEVIVDEEKVTDKVIIISIDDFDKDQRALSGLICNKLQDAYSRPAIIVFKNEEDGTYSGSCRAPDSIEAFQNFKTQCEEIESISWIAGHELAHGIGFESYDHVQAAIKEFNERYKDIDTSSTYDCDFIFGANDELLPKVIFTLGALKFWGRGVQEPLIAIDKVKIGPGTVNLVGENKGRPTLRITLPNGVVCIKFWSSREEFDSLCLPYDDVEQYYEATIVGKAEINHFNGVSTPQIMIKDYHITGVSYDF